MSSLIGNITDPFAGEPLEGGVIRATSLLAAIIRLITIGGGIYALLNLAMAGISFISSAGSPETIQRAWARIYQSIIGLSVIVLSFVFAGLLGMILFGNPSAIIDPVISGP
jgi:hypothetical protein